MLHADAILVCHCRMQKRRGLVGRHQEGFQFGFAQFELVAPFLDGLNRNGLFQVEVHQPPLLTTNLLDLSFRSADTGAGFHAQAVGLLCVGLTELRKDRRIE
ncbi:hypothetical protein [Rhizobium rhizogenes]|uniref:hypothetical protein n=1 Tax=Rhizobium rhizogenes TaxID=359 RepID=UPI0028697F64|nr:hypothetical protein [Rhizobium rhizogenes]